MTSLQLIQKLNKLLKDSKLDVQDLHLINYINAKPIRGNEDEKFCLDPKIGMFSIVFEEKEKSYGGIFYNCKFVFLFEKYNIYLGFDAIRLHGSLWRKSELYEVQKINNKYMKTNTLLELQVKKLLSGKNIDVLTITEYLCDCKDDWQTNQRFLVGVKDNSSKYLLVCYNLKEFKQKLKTINNNQEAIAKIWSNEVLIG